MAQAAPEQEGDELVTSLSLKDFLKWYQVVQRVRCVLSSRSLCRARGTRTGAPGPESPLLTSGRCAQT